MKACGMAGAQCPRQAVVTVRLAGVGDRHLCQQDHDALVALGMDVRVLDPHAFVPAWRARSLRRDFTGALR